MRAVVAVGMTVSDMDRAVEFYSTVLGLEKVSETEVAGPEFEHLEGVFGLRMRVVRMRLGEELLELTEYLAPRGRPIPVDSRSQDRWFQHVAIVVSDMDRAYARLRRYKVQHASSGPQRLPAWNKNAGGIEAFYFKDPDGHVLEVLEFPAGKGDPKWHRPSDRLFLGIDHTAIVVSDTERSLAFYRDVLGLRVAGESENYGTEQEHLNNVFGARVRITGLRADSGPGVEFLEYLAPRDGRPYPADAKANDLLHWQTTLVTPDAEAAAHALRAGGSVFISPGTVTVPGRQLGFGKGFLVRDPDGHAVEV
ncbi:MAG: VOC family protein, partial [Chloroflexota bacterium]|nr:VOC family protein [Chloroflexota bacterium]